MKRLVLLAGLVGLACGLACSSSPVDVSGDYSVQITNGSNGCNFSNFTVGAVAMDVPVTIDQINSTATATVTGNAGDYVKLVLGSNAFQGSVDGDSLDLTLDGTRAQTSGNCTYTFNANLTAALSGDSLSGTIDYSPATNGNSDCSMVAGCVTEQQFAGSRPPKIMPD